MKLIRQRTKASNRFAEALSMVSSVQTRTAKSHDYGRIFTGLLFALFVVTLLMAISAGSIVYRSVYKSGAEADEYRASLGLLTNIIKSNDSYNAVSMGQGPEGPALVLTETIGAATYETRIYEWNGSLYQDYVIPGANFDSSVAVKVADTSTFSFEYVGGLLSVTTDQGTVRVYLRTPQWGDGIISSEAGTIPVAPVDSDIIMPSGDELQMLPGQSEDGAADTDGMTPDDGFGIEGADTQGTDTVSIPDGDIGVTTTTGGGAV